MMLEILRVYTENNLKITEYTKDGKTVSHVVEEPIQTEQQPIESKLTTEEQILSENLYQTALLEMQSLGGM